MTTLLPTPAPTYRGLATLDVVVPVYNEQEDLAVSIERLSSHLASLPFGHRITIADNASTDRTADIARELSRRIEAVHVITLSQKGRGRALRQAWMTSTADVLVYMDVDLSTDLNALLPLVAPLVTGHSDVAIGTRLARASRTERGPKREFVSRSYNYLLRGALRARFSDAQCGFKAIRREVAEQLVPMVEDEAWFFDTELLVLAERAGLRIHEVPVDWTDDPDSSVDIVRTALDDLRGMARLGWSLTTGRTDLTHVRSLFDRTARRGAAGQLRAQVVLFGLVGVMSTLFYAAVFLGLRSAMAAQWANAGALAISAVANTAANRRLTFGVVGRQRAVRHHLQGLAVFGAGLALTSTALWSLHAWSDGPHPLIEIAVLTVANLVVTGARFAAMRWWIFAHRGEARSVTASGRQ